MCLSLFLMKLKPVSNTSVIFSNFLSFRLFIFWNHIALPWLSMTFTWIPWISRPGNWNRKFYDFPGFPWHEWTLKETLLTQKKFISGWSIWRTWHVIASGGQRKQQRNGEKVEPIWDRELTCQMFPVHATVKSHHLQKTTMMKMMSNWLNR